MKRVKTLLIALLFAMGGAVNAQEGLKDDITMVLEHFCEEYYDNYFAPRQFVVSTLEVTSIDWDYVNGKYMVKGNYVCRGAHIPIAGRVRIIKEDFKAEIIPGNNRSLRIKFWSWFTPVIRSKVGRWEGPCIRELTSH